MTGSVFGGRRPAENNPDRPAGLAGPAERGPAPETAPAGAAGRAEAPDGAPRYHPSSRAELRRQARADTKSRRLTDREAAALDAQRAVPGDLPLTRWAWPIRTDLDTAGGAPPSWTDPASKGRCTGASGPAPGRRRR